MNETAPQIEATELEVRLRFKGSLINELFASPRITIDGQTHKAKWGTRHFRLDPGKHSVEVCFRYLFLLRFGRKSIEFSLDQNQIRKIEYANSSIIFLPGSIRILA